MWVMSGASVEGHQGIAQAQSRGCALCCAAPSREYPGAYPRPLQALYLPNEGYTCALQVPQGRNNPLNLQKQ